MKIGNVELKVVDELPYFFDSSWGPSSNFIGGNKMLFDEAERDRRQYVLDCGFDLSNILVVVKSKPSGIIGDYGCDVQEWKHWGISWYGFGIRDLQNVHELVQRYISKYEEKGLVLVSEEVEDEIGLVASFKGK